MRKIKYDVKRLKQNFKEIEPSILEGHILAAKIYIANKWKEGVVHGQGWQLGWQNKNGKLKIIAVIRENETMEDYIIV
jgi:hypothetical protein